MRTILVGSVIVIVSWTVENNLIYLRSILIGPGIVIVSRGNKGPAVMIYKKIKYQFSLKVRKRANIRNR